MRIANYSTNRTVRRWFLFKLGVWWNKSIALETSQCTCHGDFQVSLMHRIYRASKIMKMSRVHNWLRHHCLSQEPGISDDKTREDNLLRAINFPWVGYNWAELDPLTNIRQCMQFFMVILNNEFKLKIWFQLNNDLRWKGLWIKDMIFVYQFYNFVHMDTSNLEQQ